MRNRVGDPDWQCSSKRLYITLSRAKLALAKMKRVSGRRVSKLLKPYKCPHCGQWHLGHRKRPVNKLKRKPEGTDGHATRTTD